jgi:Uma2 family endonuclease
MLADIILSSGTLFAMPMDPKQRLYEDYLAVPEYRKAEIVDGTLWELPRPAPPHANAASVLGARLNTSFHQGDGGPGGWWILNEPELHLVPLEPMSPDICGWRVERMPNLPSTAFFELAPDWVCEVLSPSTTWLDRHHKMPIFARHGVKHVWLVDPIGQSLEVHYLGEQRTWSHVRALGGNVKVRIAPFDAIELDLAALWSPPTK